MQSSLVKLLIVVHLVVNIHYVCNPRVVEARQGPSKTQFFGLVETPFDSRDLPYFISETIGTLFKLKHFLKDKDVM